MSAFGGCVAVVDPLSTGAHIACEVASRGYQVIAVWCGEVAQDAEIRAHVPEQCRHLKFHAEVDEHATIEETAAAVREAAGKLELVACIVGCETGVTLADELSEKLGLQTNGTSLKHRRNKSVQQRAVKGAGLRAVREAGGTQWGEVAQFVDKEAMPVVVKPVESAGSDGVKLCYTKGEAEDHFNLLMSAQQKCGGKGAAVLVQEYLKGKEYVVDHVSSNGVHKTVMIWVYDKRPCNGAHFVYFGTLPVPSDSEVAKQLIAYTRGVLDALKIQHGATHGEIMMTEDGPCLVEMNCRAHGGDGAWIPLAKALTGGYTQVSAGVDAFLDLPSFDKLPSLPPSPFKAHGQQLDLVSMREGLVKSLAGFERIKKLPSFVSLETSVNIGSRANLTVDIFTQAGSVILINDDAKQLATDIATIRDMEMQCTMFEFEEEAFLLSSRPSAFGRSLSTDGNRSRGASFSGSPRRLRSQSEGALNGFTAKAQERREWLSHETAIKKIGFNGVPLYALLAATFAAGCLCGTLIAGRRRC